MNDQEKSINIYATKFQKSEENLANVKSRSRENARYYRGDNWSQRQRENANAQGMKSYAIAMIAVKLNRILSIQRSNRFDWKVRGRGLEDELRSEIISYLLKFVDDDTKFKWTESEIYKDGLAKVCGILKTWVDYTENPRGDIANTRILLDNFYWDTNSTAYSLHEDCTFMGESVLIPLQYAQQLYPDLDLKTDSAGDTKLIGANYENLQVTDWFDNTKKLIRINEHYDYSYSTSYLAKNFKTGSFQKFTAKMDAQSWIRDQQEEQAGLMSQGQASLVLTPEDFSVIPKSLKVWDKIVFTGNSEIHKTQHRYSRPPYHRYSALEDDGEMWSLTDLAKDPQVAYDRYLAMVDKSVAKNIKGNNYIYYPELFHKDETHDYNAVSRRLSNGGSYVLGAKAGQSPVEPMPSHNNIEVEFQLLSTFQGIVEDILGGRTFQGLEGNQNQTATEVQINDNNSKQVGMLFVDNLARFRHDVGEYTVEVIQDIYTEDRQVKVVGEVTSKQLKETFANTGIYVDSAFHPSEHGYIDLSKVGKPLRGAETDLVIDDVNATATEKEKKFIQVMQANNMEIQAGRPPYSSDVLMYYSPFDPSVKNMIIEDRKMREMQMQKAQQRAEDVEAVKTLADVGSKYKPEEKQDMTTPIPLGTRPKPVEPSI